MARVARTAGGTEAALSNDEAFARMREWSAKLRQLPALARSAAPAVAEAVGAVLRGNLQAQRGPDGEAWAPRKSGDGPMLESAAANLQVTAEGTKVTAKIKSRNVFRHHAGIARGAPARKVLPGTSLPAPVAEAVARVIGEAFKDHFDG